LSFRRSLIWMWRATRPANFRWRGAPVGQIMLDVLVVDNEVAIGELLLELLGEEGYRVGWAPDAEDALRQVTRDRPRVVLSDVMMPGIDGVELVRRLELLERGRPPRCILMSAGTRPAHVPAQIPYIPKPYNVERLLNVVAAEVVEAVRAEAYQRTPERVGLGRHLLRGAFAAAAL
jgi:CheY-like chemotaxis protein